jgi:hypothetical protein
MCCAVGREAAGQLIRYVHEGAFDARPELKSLLVDEGKAAIEADFVVTHAGEFASARRGSGYLARRRGLPGWLLVSGPGQDDRG